MVHIYHGDIQSSGECGPSMGKNLLKWRPVGLEDLAEETATSFATCSQSRFGFCSPDARGMDSQPETDSLPGILWDMLFLCSSDFHKHLQFISLNVNQMVKPNEPGGTPSSFCNSVYTS
jgi:hypothetical protein